MPRATNSPASRARRKRVIEEASGYRGRRSKLFRYAKDARMKGKYWAYRDRKTRKRNVRSLWIVRLNAAVRAQGLSYNRFIEIISKPYFLRHVGNTAIHLLCLFKAPALLFN